MEHQPLRAIVASPDPAATRLLEKAVAIHPRFHLSASVPNAVFALEAAQREDPHVVVLTQEMPGMSGYEAAKEIARLVPTCQSIIATVGMNPREWTDDADVFGSMSLHDLAGMGRLLDLVAECVDHPLDRPERRHSNRRDRQDWNQVSRERRSNERRQLAESAG